MVGEVLRETEGDKWMRSEDAADLGNAAHSLARIGDPHYFPLVVEVAKRRMDQIGSLMDALGFVDLPESRVMLARHVEESLRRADTGGYVNSLLALTRLNDDGAIARYRELTGGSLEEATAAIEEALG